MNGRRLGAVAQEFVAAEGLTAGQLLDDELAARLHAAMDDEGAFRTVLEALERRAYSRVDLGRRLVGRGAPRAAVERALARAAALGLLDDAAYAEHYVRTRAARGRGPARLVWDLLARGVDRAHIDRAIAAEWPEGADCNTAAHALAVKRAAQLGDLPRQVKRRRLVAYLARRGYVGREVTEMVARVVK